MMTRAHTNLARSYGLAFSPYLAEPKGELPRIDSSFEQPRPDRPISPWLSWLTHIANDKRSMAKPNGDVESGASFTHRIPHLHIPRHNDINLQTARSALT